MTRVLTLSDALEDEGYSLLAAYRDKRAEGKTRVKVVVGRLGGRRVHFPSEGELPRVDEIVKRYLPGAMIWNFGGVFVSNVPRGTKLHLGTPSLVKAKRKLVDEHAWKLRIIKAAGGDREPTLFEE